MIYTLEGFLTVEECDAAIAMFPPPRPATTISEAPDPQAARRSSASFLVADTAQKRALVGKVQAALERANHVLFKFDLAGTEPLQLAEYAEGDGYGKHLDLGPGRAALRKLSASVQLTDPSEYDGGDLFVWGSAPPPKERGSITIFPSYLVHQVVPVTRGLRRSLVAWAVGERPFR